jgi:RhoGEF domain
VERLAELERVYAGDLDRLVEQALLPARQVDGSEPAPLSEQQVGVLFGDAEVLRGYNTLLLAELQRRAAEARLCLPDSDSSSALSDSGSSELCTPRHPVQLADLFLQMEGTAEAYARYLSALPAALAILESGERRAEVAAWFHSRLGSAHPLAYLLLRPLLQLWSYHRALEEFATVTPSAHPDRHLLPQARQLFSRAVAVADRALGSAADSDRASGVLLAVADVLAVHGRLRFFTPTPTLRRRLLFSTASPCMHVYALSKRRLLCGGHAASLVLLSDTLVLVARYSKGKARKPESVGGSGRSKRAKHTKWEKQLSLVQIVRVISDPALLTVTVPNLTAMREAFAGASADGHESAAPPAAAAAQIEAEADAEERDDDTHALERVFAVVSLDETLILRAESVAMKQHCCTALTDAIQQVLV